VGYLNPRYGVAQVASRVKRNLGKGIPKSSLKTRYSWAPDVTCGLVVIGTNRDIDAAKIVVAGTAQRERVHHHTTLPYEVCPHVNCLRALCPRVTCLRALPQHANE
jgi:hypothetical protein